MQSSCVSVLFCMPSETKTPVGIGLPGFFYRTGSSARIRLWKSDPVSVSWVT